MRHVETLRAALERVLNAHPKDILDHTIAARAALAATAQSTPEPEPEIIRVAQQSVVDSLFSTLILGIHELAAKHGPVYHENLMALMRDKLTETYPKGSGAPTINPTPAQSNVDAQPVEVGTIGHVADRGPTLISALGPTLLANLAAPTPDPRIATLTAQLADMTAERDKLALKAARYDRLSQRVEIKLQQAMSGSVRPGLSLRVGCSFVDSPVADRPEKLSKLDSAIDAAIAATQESSK